MSSSSSSSRSQRTPSLFIGLVRNRGERPKELEDVVTKAFHTIVIGNIHLFNLFMPLVMKGKVKKIIGISSCHADLDLINHNSVDKVTLFAASKPAFDVIVSKFSAQYKRDGVLLMSLCSGIVDVGHYGNATPEQTKGMMRIMSKMSNYAPHWKSPTTLEDAIPIIRSTWERTSIESRYSGAFVSHFGNKQ